MTSVPDAHAGARWSALHGPVARAWLRPFLIAGIACVIGGGLLAAATAYVTTQKTAWATAYIVLVGGVAQIGLGAGVAWLSPLAPRRPAWWAFAGWNLGNAGVLAGQLAGIVVLTDIGTVLLVVGLVTVLVAVRSHRRGAAQAEPTVPAPSRQVMPGVQPDYYIPLASPHPGVLWAFRGLVILLVVTMPIGVILAHLGA
jgi:hypothetical protein